jgi:hypothetical protein
MVFKKFEIIQRSYFKGFKKKSAVLTQPRSVPSPSKWGGEWLIDKALSVLYYGYDYSSSKSCRHACRWPVIY